MLRAMLWNVESFREIIWHVSCEFIYCLLFFRFILKMITREIKKETSMLDAFQVTDNEFGNEPNEENLVDLL